MPLKCSKRSETELEEQLEIKGILGMRDGSFLKLSKGKEIDEKHKEQCDKFNPIFADLLMQLRTSTSQHWQALKEEERKLTIEVVQDRATISRMLKDECHQAQNREMDACLVEIANDDPVVLLAIEEWYEKFYALDKSHEQHANSWRIKRWKSHVLMRRKFFLSRKRRRGTRY